MQSMQPVLRKPFPSTRPAFENYYATPMAPERVRKLINELKEYSRRHEIKQIELASMLGIKPQQLNDWFNGRREPTAERVLHIMELLKRKPSKLPKRRKPGNP